MAIGLLVALIFRLIDGEKRHKALRPNLLSF